MTSVTSTAQHIAHGSRHSLASKRAIAGRVVSALRASGEDGWVVEDWGGGFWNATRYSLEACTLIGVQEDAYGPAFFVVVLINPAGETVDEHTLSPDQPLSDAARVATRWALTPSS